MLSESEIRSGSHALIRSLFEGDTPFSVSVSECNQKEILKCVIQGGFPGLLDCTNLQDRAYYYRDYLTNQILHDMKEAWGFRKPSLIEAVIRYSAAFSGKLLNIKAMGTQFSANWQTLSKHLEALQTMYMVETLPLWTPNEYEREGKTPKIFVNDSGLAAYLLGIHSLDALLNDEKKRADHIGKLMETWVYAQLMVEVDQNPLWKMYHWRSSNYAEIDFLIENEKGQMLGIEVKSSETVSESDFRHLNTFAKKNPTVDFRGFVFYTGNHVIQCGSMLALPMASLWV